MLQGTSRLHAQTSLAAAVNLPPVAPAPVARPSVLQGRRAAQPSFCNSTPGGSRKCCITAGATSQPTSTAASTSTSSSKDSSKVDSSDSSKEPTLPSTAAGEKVEAKSDVYSETMQKKMGTTLTYRHENGLDYNRILPDLIVGSCLQTAADVDRLADQEGVTTIFCLQEDSDMAWFNLDIKPIQERCAERGDIKHVRFPIRDFDPFDLRLKLPKAIARLTKEHNPQNGGTIYIHCTAGMGRAPGAALAYMNWFRDFQLDKGYELVTTKRRCSPKVEAIRAATVDLLCGSKKVPVTIGVLRPGLSEKVQIAGLDVGWNTRLDLTRNPVTKRFELQRELLPGRYQYKFIFDDHWTYSADHPTMQDGDNLNNYEEALGKDTPPELLQAQIRLLTKGGDLTAAERQQLQSILCPWDTHEDSTPQLPVPNSRDIALKNNVGDE